MQNSFAAISLRKFGKRFVTTYLNALSKFQKNEANNIVEKLFRGRKDL